MKLSKHLNVLMASAVSVSLAASPIGVMPSYAQNAPAAEAPSDAGWQKEFQLWRSVSRSGKSADYQSYLKAYPAGKFASVAKQRMDSLNGVATTEAAKPADDAKAAKQTADTADVQADDAQPMKAADADAQKKADLEMWRQVSKTGKQADYKKYLKTFPKGKFAKIAKTRVDDMIAAAKAPAADTQNTAQNNADDNAVQDQAQNNQADDTQPADQSQEQATDQGTPADDAQQQDQAAAQADDSQQDQAASQTHDAQQQEQAKAPAGDWEQEYALWKAASDGNTVKEYEAYLSTYPKGKFAAIAQARIVQLAAAEQPADNVAEGDEQPADQQANTAKQPNDQSQDQAQDQNQDQNQDQSQDQAQDQNQQQSDDQSNQTDQANQMDPNQDPNQAQADDQSQVATNQQDNQNQNDMGQNAQPDQNIQYSEGSPQTEDDFLNREGRHEVQGRLTSLGYDTFGSDGSFGPNSRTAISNWQTDNGAPVTGYLSGDQIAQIRKLSQVSYANWMNSQQAVVEQRIVRPRREKVVVIEERRNHALDAAIAVGVLGAVVGANRIGRYKVGRVRPGRVQVIGKFKFGKMNKFGCRKKRRC